MAAVTPMAAPAGGNCPLTEVGQTVQRYGVTIIGETIGSDGGPNWQNYSTWRTTSEALHHMGFNEPSSRLYQSGDVLGAVDGAGEGERGGFISVLHVE